MSHARPTARQATERGVGRGVRLALTLLAACVTATGVSSAQPARPAVEVWGGMLVTRAAPGGTLDAEYAPTLAGNGAYTSRSYQSLIVDAGCGHGVEGGANVFPSRWLGIQVAFDWSRASLRGVGNGNRDLFLRYISTQPPDYVPREQVLTRSDAWPDTAGTLTYRAVSIGGVARWRAGRRWGGTVSGGVNLAHIDADVDGVSYVTYRLGGHSTLFSDEHRIAMSTRGSEWLVGPYLAGDVHALVGRRLAVFGGLRVDVGTSVPVAVRAERVIDPEDGVSVPDLSELREVLKVGPAWLPSARWHLSGGIKIFLPR
jgi:hypothetical protein